MNNIKNARISLSAKLLLPCMVTVWLGGCALPVGKTAAVWQQIDSNSACTVLGVWDRYTWSGTCEEGHPAGYGELKGYGGSTEMMSYVGTMRAGLREGQGTMIVNGRKSDGGPITTRGHFVNGNFRDGTKSYSGTLQTYLQGNLVTTEHPPASAENSGSGFLSFLGAVTQGLAAAGGKNSAQLNTLASSIQTTNGQLASGGGSTTALSAPAYMPKASGSGTTANASGSKTPGNGAIAGNSGKAQSKDPFRYSAAVSQCITESNARLHNSCGFAVTITHCNEGTVPSGDLAGHTYHQCRDRVFGTTDLPAGGTEATPRIAYRGTKIYFIACKQPFYADSGQLVYNSGRIEGKCQAANT